MTISLIPALPLLATVGDTLKTVMGVVLAVAGLGILLMGVIALADRSVQKGATAALLGAVLIAAGFWMVGVL
jgi:hypothetical protein